MKTNERRTIHPVEINEKKLSWGNLKTKFVTIVVQLFRVRGLSKEKQFQRISFIFSLFCITGVGICALPLLYFYFRLTNFVVSCVTLVSVYVALIIYFIWVKFQVLLFLHCILCAFAMAWIQFNQAGGIVTGGFIVVISLVPVQIWTSGGNIFNKIFSLSVFVICTIAMVIVDLVMTNEDKIISEIRSKGIYFVISLKYTFIYAPVLNSIALIISSYFKEEKFKKSAWKVKELALAISTLNLENEELLKIEEKKEEESDEIEIVFQTIIRNVRVYSTYLPESLKASAANTFSASNSHSDSTNSKGSSQGSGKNKNNTNNEKELLDRDHSFGLQDKNVTICVIHYASLFKLNHPIEIITQLHSRIVDICCESAKKCKGNVHSFDERFIVIGFNSMYSNFQHEEKACEFAINFVERIKKLNKFLKITAFVNTMRAYLGNIGGNEFKKFTIISCRDDKGKGIRYAKNCALKMSEFGHHDVTTTKGVYERSKYKFHLKPIELIKRSGEDKVETVYALVGQKRKRQLSSGEEWNHEISEMIEDDNLLEMSWEKFIVKEFKEAKKLIEKYLEEDNNATCRIGQNLRDRIIEVREGGGSNLKEIIIPI